jgi:endonuclease YncB( thermonuclease family)
MRGRCWAVVLVMVAVPAKADFDGRVVRVHDGDTLTVFVDRTQYRVRLVDIDAPELGQAFGKRSMHSLAGMCAGQPAHVIEKGKDRYRRILGRVTCGPYEANMEQVRRGMAWVFVRYAPKSSELYDLQAQARLDRRGLWVERGAVAPWEWRATKITRQSSPIGH